jgi:hypothetical protein
MKNYVVFDPATGEILRAGHCQDSDLELQDPNGNVLESDAQDDTHYVVDGEVVAYTDDQAAAKASRPTYPATWSNTTFVWVDDRALDKVRADQWSAIKAARSAAVAGGFGWNGMSFQSDPTSQGQIQGAVQLAVLAAQAGQPFTINWTLTDNTVATLSGADMIQVGLAMGAFVQAQYDKGVALRNQIDAATDAEAVQAITWE